MLLLLCYPYLQSSVVSSLNNYCYQIIFAEENTMQHLGFVDGLTSFPKQFEKWISYNKIYHIANILTPNVAADTYIFTCIYTFL